jgi:biopolymer transport protein TolR
VAMNPQSNRNTRVSLAEINVTPMVDVMLVLLIVFMVSAPLLQQGVEVNLPKANAGSLAQSESPVILIIKSNQQIEVDHKIYAASAIGEKLQLLAASNPKVQVLVEADHVVPYGVVAQVIAQIKKAKISRVGLVTAPEGSGQQ